MYPHLQKNIFPFSLGKTPKKYQTSMIFRFKKIWCRFFKTPNKNMFKKLHVVFICLGATLDRPTADRWIFQNFIPKSRRLRNGWVAVGGWRLLAPPISLLEIRFLPFAVLLFQRQGCSWCWRVYVYRSIYLSCFFHGMRVGENISIFCQQFAESVPKVT